MAHKHKHEDPPPVEAKVAPMSAETTADAPGTTIYADGGPHTYAPDAYPGGPPPGMAGSSDPGGVPPPPPPPVGDEGEPEPVEPEPEPDE